MKAGELLVRLRRDLPAWFDNAKLRRGGLGESCGGIIGESLIFSQVGDRQSEGVHRDEGVSTGLRARGRGSDCILGHSKGEPYRFKQGASLRGSGQSRLVLSWHLVLVEQNGASPADVRSQS